MKLVEMRCKNCGAKLEVEENVKDINCKFCHTNYKLDDEVKHIQYDNMEQSGYEFEKGRIRAQQEQIESNKIDNENTNKPSDNKHGCLFYLFYICFWPIIFTYYLISTDKLTRKAKIGIIITIIVFIIIYKNLRFDGFYFASDCTPISDFDYSLNGKEIEITGYNGLDRKIKICSNYYIKGYKYTVTESSFILEDVYSIVFPNTLKEAPIIMSSNLKYVYIPKSLKYFNKSDLSNTEVIYYSGSKEEWNELIGDLYIDEFEDKKIIYNVKIDD